MQPKIIVGPGGTPFTVFDDSIPRTNGRNGKADHAPAVTIFPASAYTPEAVRPIWDGYLFAGSFISWAARPAPEKRPLAFRSRRP